MLNKGHTYTYLYLCCCDAVLLTPTHAAKHSPLCTHGRMQCCSLVVFAAASDRFWESQLSKLFHGELHFKITGMLQRQGGAVFRDSIPLKGTSATSSHGSKHRHPLSRVLMQLTVDLWTSEKCLHAKHFSSLMTSLCYNLVLVIPGLLLLIVWGAAPGRFCPFSDTGSRDHMYLLRLVKPTKDNARNSCNCHCLGPHKYSSTSVWLFSKHALVVIKTRSKHSTMSSVFLRLYKSSQRWPRFLRAIVSSACVFPPVIAGHSVYVCVCLCVSVMVCRISNH